MSLGTFSVFLLQIYLFLEILNVKDTVLQSSPPEGSDILSNMEEELMNIFDMTSSMTPSKVHMDRKEKWSLGLFSNWLHATDVQLCSGKHMDDILLKSSIEDLDQILSMFISEVRQSKKGKRYQIESLRQIVTSIQRHLRNRARFVSLLTDPQFCLLQGSMAIESLDNLNLESQASRVYPISQDLESQLWNSGGLGYSNPQTLLDTFIFYCGLNFGLINGSPLRQIRFQNTQIKLLVTKEGKSYIRYIIPMKGSSATLCEKGTEVPSCVDIYTNHKHKRDRSLVHIYELYNSKW